MSGGAVMRARSRYEALYVRDNGAMTQPQKVREKRHAMLLRNSSGARAARERDGKMLMPSRFMEEILYSSIERAGGASALYAAISPFSAICHADGTFITRY